VNEKGASDRTALHRAAGANHVEIISYLLKNDATIDSKDRYQRTPLFWAAIGTCGVIKHPALFAGTVCKHAFLLYSRQYHLIIAILLMHSSLRCKTSVR
jgi:Ankyrin repeats (3 copies)